MTDEIRYFFADRPLYTENAIEVLDGMQDVSDGLMAEGDATQVPRYAILQGEKDSLQEYLENLRPYDQFLDEAYQSFEVPGSHVLKRVEEDMDLMARERDSRLNDNAFNGDTRREILDELMPEDVPRPVMSDTWVIMKEAEGLREYLDRRVE